MLAYNLASQKIHTETFDGPLELLMYLIGQQGIDIREVQIAPITDAFLLHMETIEVMNLNTAGDFLVMAATLCYLKSKELLPSHDDKNLAPEQDPDEIRRELAQRLAEYKRFKDASIRLSQRPLLNREIFVRPKTKIDQKSKVAETDINALELLKIFQLLVKSQNKDNHQQIIERATYSLQELGEWILNKLLDGSIILHGLLEHFDSVHNRIVAFLAVLELGKFHYIRLEQTEHLSPIYTHPNFEGEAPNINLHAEVGL